MSETFQSEAQVSRFYFKISEYYDEREIEDLLETIIERGADYDHEGEGWYLVTVPENLSWVPFYRAAKKCQSIAQVERRAERLVVYQCEPEG